MTRETWIELFEAASEPGNELNDEWKWLIAELGLSLEDYSALLDTLRQGRWRQAKNPRSYVKTVAKREALKARLAAAMPKEFVLMPESHVVDGGPETSLSQVYQLQETAEAVKGTDGVWRRGGGAERLEYERFDEDEHGQPISLRGRILAKVPNKLKTLVQPSEEFKQLVEELDFMNKEWHIHPEPQVHIDLMKLAEWANFDEWEQKVLLYQMSEISRDRALAEQPDETSRKALQAAWRRYDRTGKHRLKETAEKNMEEDVPELPLPHTRR